MISPRNSLWLIPLLLFVTFPLWKIPVASFLAPRGGFDPEFSKRKIKEHNFFMTGVTISQAEKGKETAKIRASKARTSQRPNEYILDDVIADVLDDQGDITNIVANTGNYNSIIQELQLRGDVVISKTNGEYVMKTDLLYHNGEKRDIYCPGKTFLTGDGITINGSSFYYDMNSATYEIGGRVHSTVRGYDGS